MIELNWSNFKSQCLDAAWQYIYFDVDNTYKIYASKGDFKVLCQIYKDNGADQTDFEDNYQSDLASDLSIETRSRFEREDIVLKLSRISGQADANGDLVLDIDFPGERYLAGGYAFTDNYTWTDKVSKVEVLDYMDLTGAGLNAVIKEYYDSELPSANQGWPFWKTFGNEGECEIEPMGWYGHLAIPLRVRITFKVAANANVKAAIWAGKV